LTKEKKKKKDNLRPEGTYDLNGPDDVEIGDGVTPYEDVKRKEKKDKKKK